MSPAFTDHFQNVAHAYADSRPGYPAELFTWLAAHCATRDCAWDCATGSGQAACDLSGHFTQVVATDASAAQLAHAVPCAGVDYRQAPAEASGLPAQSVDLIVVAQALHWFDSERFFVEARRVLKPGGLLAVWCYGVMQVEGAAVDALLQDFYQRVVGPYWPAERRHVENAYRELQVPWPHLPVPEFAMRQHWNLAQLAGYLRSWSATARCQQASGRDPVADLLGQLGPRWGEPQRTRRIAWPLAVQVGIQSNALQLG